MMTSAMGGASRGGAAGPTDLFGKPGGELGKDEFLQLLVTQLRYQDPLNPMQAEDFAAQLAQFSSLEQLMNANVRLDAQITHMYSLAQGINTTAALGVLGGTVVAEVDEVLIPEGGPGTARVTVGGEGGFGAIKFYDADGKEIGSTPLGFLGEGRHTFELDAGSIPAGAHSYSFAVTDAAGEAVPSQTLTQVRVDGVRYGAAGPVLVAGGYEIPLSAIVEVIRNAS